MDISGLRVSVDDEVRASGNTSISFERELFNTLWISMGNSAGAACNKFSVPVLEEFRNLFQAIQANHGNWICEGQPAPIHYTVLRSQDPRYFSLGGDLAHFLDCIRRRDRDALYRYSRLSLDLTYEAATSSVRGTTAIALVQGRALGGGFELALSADVLIAEEQSEFSFPEIMFGLFPCSGGMSFLTRRVSVNQAARMLADPRIYTAVELKEMGLVDEVCARGDGELVVREFIGAHAKSRTARLMLQRARHRMAKLDYSELLTVVDDWVETALGLDEENLRTMEMLSRLQQSMTSAAT